MERDEKIPTQRYRDKTKGEMKRYVERGRRGEEMGRGEKKRMRSRTKEDVKIRSDIFGPVVICRVVLRWEPQYLSRMVLHLDKTS
jgi:hypothetical protein